MERQWGQRYRIKEKIGFLMKGGRILLSSEKRGSHKERLAKKMEMYKIREEDKKNWQSKILKEKPEPGFRDQHFKSPCIELVEMKGHIKVMKL